MTTDRGYKMRLRAARKNDEKHETEMQRLARKAGVNLQAIRALDLEGKDRAFTAMLKKAGEN